MTARAGDPHRLGAWADGSGTNFAVFSHNAERIELCLFGSKGNETRVDLEPNGESTWSIFLDGVGPGQRYGFRAHGPFAPGMGHRFNPSKLLTDPYALTIDGQVNWHPAVFGHAQGDPDGHADGHPGGEIFNDADSAPFVPRSVVADTDFDWQQDAHPSTPWEDTILYETHVKGFSAANARVASAHRGTYLGLGSAASTTYLKSLGVTAVELLPVQHHVHDESLRARSLTNYWGYQPLAYMAPHSEYASTADDAVSEFKRMVKSLHASGLEVILDVVYNHTCEWDDTGPVLCYRGLENSSYYLLDERDPRQYVDFTGVGNTLNVNDPWVLRLVMDSLRYWVTEMHVDGFRFDLTCALGRDPYDFDPDAPLFAAIAQDPVLNRVKLIAEPWDVGMGGYQVGNFPAEWSEWNGMFRDDVRDFWRGASAGVSKIATRLSGSSDLYGRHGSTRKSINFITAHDGFTLRDLVTYNDKHNESNGEDNADGENYNRSWNCGVEGPIDDRDIKQLRQQQIRNFMTTLLLSQGVPMILAGDEYGRTQHGNNNAYCHDDASVWLDWEHDHEGKTTLEFTKRLIGIRSANPVFRNQRFFTGKPVNEGGQHDVGWVRPDVGWFRPDGEAMNSDDWAQDFIHCLTVMLAGPGAEPNWLMMINGFDQPVDFHLPHDASRLSWRVAVDTSDAVSESRDLQGEQSHVPGRSILCLDSVTG